MDQTSDDGMSDSLCSFVKNNTAEDHHAMIRDLDKKIEAQKESKVMKLALIDETQAEMEAYQKQRGQTSTQVSDARKRIEALRETVQNARNEKAAAEQAERQRSEHQKKAGMTMEQMVELRDQLTSQRSRLADLEEQIDQLEKEKIVNQKQYVEYNSALKNQTNACYSLRNELESIGERREYLSETYANLSSSVEAIREDIQRLRAKLANPTKNEDSAQGQSLFEEVIAEKKTLEQELITLLDITSNIRQQIRQKLEEIDELESHENENLCSVDTDYVCRKMSKLLDEKRGISDAVKKIELLVSEGVTQIEQVPKHSADEQVELGKQYLNLRDYRLDCAKNAIYECDEAISSEQFSSIVDLVSNPSGN